MDKLRAMTLVSVVIPTYNRAQMVKRAIQSALAQTHAAIEVLVIDDGSTDETVAAVGSIPDSRVSCLRQESNRGHAAARNSGIAASSGDYVAFLDSDDEWVPGKLELQLSSIGECGVSVSGRRTVDDSGRVVKVTRQLVSGDIWDSTIGLEWVPATSTLLVRRDLLEHELFDEQLNALVDLDLVIRLAQRSCFSGVEEPLATIHSHSGQRVRSPDNAPELWLMLLEKYRALMSPRNRSAFHYRAFLTAYELDRFAFARTQLWNSLRLDPRGAKRWMRLSSMMLGPRVHRRAQVLVGRR